MKNKFWINVLSGAAALVCAGAANAYVIDFENPDTSGAPFAPLLSDGDAVVQGGYTVQALDVNNGGDFNGSLVGQLMNGSDPASCLDGACSGGNSTNYLAALNNGVLYVEGPGSFQLGSFDAAFLAPSGLDLPSGTVASLGIQVDRDDGSHALGLFNLAGPSATTGVTSLASYAASSAKIVDGSGSLTSGNVVDFYMFAYYCGASTTCTPFTDNKVQFAVDNIAVNVTAAVPEPAEWLLMTLGLGLGLGTVAGIARRRRRPA